MRRSRRYATRSRPGRVCPTRSPRPGRRSSSRAGRGRCTSGSRSTCSSRPRHRARAPAGARRGARSPTAASRARRELLAGAERPVVAARRRRGRRGRARRSRGGAPRRADRPDDQRARARSTRGHPLMRRLAHDVRAGRAAVRSRPTSCSRWAPSSRSSTGGRSTRRRARPGALVRVDIDAGQLDAAARAGRCTATPRDARGARRRRSRRAAASGERRRARGRALRELPAGPGDDGVTCRSWRRSTRRCPTTASSPPTRPSPPTRRTTPGGPAALVATSPRSATATLGSALPMAIGAKLAAPERPVAALAGDGGVLFTIQELASRRATWACRSRSWSGRTTATARSATRWRQLASAAGHGRQRPRTSCAIAEGFGCRGERAPTSTTSRRWSATRWRPTAPR